ncbi:MAG: rlpB [Ramlibacter sp.]|jgi:LPS-assembly lipoprotein|nr:rlpB [Ramlibacter sp.]MDB5913526.1 rlpB [Ramlibacter sp.]
MKRRHLLHSLAAPVLLAGCGFKLREAPDFAFDSIVLNAPASSPLIAQLRRSLEANGKVQVLAPTSVAPLPAGAASAPVAVVPPVPGGRVALDLLQELREKVVVGINASGQVREFQLRSRIRFRLRAADGRELIPETELLQQRDISFNEAAVLAKEAEEALLYRDMQSDLVQQLMRRLAAVRTV